MDLENFLILATLFILGPALVVLAFLIVGGAA